MLSEKTLKVAGIAVSLAGFGLSYAADWISDLKIEKMIEEKVAEAIAQVKK